jgi:hypothetical protein
VSIGVMRGDGVMKGGRMGCAVCRVLALGSVVLGVAVLYGGLWGVDGVVGSWRGGVLGGGGHENIEVLQDGYDEADVAGVDEDALHPIEQLMSAAEKDFVLKIGAQATSLTDAAQRYRERRGRHPPPGFDKWYAYAAQHDAVIVESFFDQIDDDLGPFWGVDVYDLRRIVQTFTPKISVRNETAGSAVENSYERLRGMVDMLTELVGTEGVDVPDMDFPFNVNVEVGMLVEWEELTTAVELARPMLTAPNETVGDFTPINHYESVHKTFDPEWLDGRLRHTTHTENYGPRPFWSLVIPACSPSSPTRNEGLWADIWHKQGHTIPEHSAAALLPLESPEGAFEGYVKNWTVVGDVCAQPWLQGLHGAFVAPEEMSVTKKLFPFFSASKIGVGREILVPSVGRWNDSTATSSTPWNEKLDKLFWRGPATGGKNSALNWQRFHRHRFVAMLNATHVEIAEGLLHAGNESMVGLGYAQNFRLLPGNLYGLDSQRGGRLAHWVNSWADAAFTDLHCNVADGGGGCAYTDEYFSVDAEQDLSSISGQEYKYAAVLDGDGGDDREEFIDVVRAGRVVLKASVYSQWFDSRVVPWVHFVPLDNTFVDVYGVMEFFLGTRTQEEATQFAHAHVELPKHEHHFQTPHSEDKQEEDQHEEHEGEHEQAHATLVKRWKTLEDGHDDAARKIAEAGQAWAAKVLRKEDMFIYMYRLLLEYARVVDTRRERLGWVEDLIATDGS